MSDADFSGFVQVATDGNDRYQRGEQPVHPLGDITDPTEAYKTATFMLALKVTLSEEYSKTFCSTDPKRIDATTYEVQAVPLSPLVDILRDAQEITKRIKERGYAQYGDQTVNYPRTDITLRVAVFRTSFDVKVDSDIEQLYERWRAEVGKEDVPVFGDPVPASVIVGIHAGHFS